VVNYFSLFVDLIDHFHAIMGDGILLLRFAYIMMIVTFIHGLSMPTPSINSHSILTTIIAPTTTNMSPFTAHLDERETTSGLVSRASFVRNIAMTAASLVLIGKPTTAIAAEEVTLPNGVSYQVIKKGDGPKPNIGELAAIRFVAYCGDIQIDNILETPEPYYTRIGSGGLIAGVEQTLPLMRVGDRWKLTIPVCEDFLRSTN
jgi:hypothetical protein